MNDYILLDSGNLKKLEQVGRFRLIGDDEHSVKVKAVYSEDGAIFETLAEKPDEFDEVLLHCVIEKLGDAVQIKTAFLVSFEAVEAPVKTITIAEAIEICKANSEPTVERYLIRATIVKVSNPSYGEMTVADETGELYVYGSYNADGTVGYANMTDRPVKGDEVAVYGDVYQSRLQDRQRD